MSRALWRRHDGAPVRAQQWFTRIGLLAGRLRLKHHRLPTPLDLCPFHDICTGPLHYFIQPILRLPLFLDDRFFLF